MLRHLAICFALALLLSGVSACGGGPSDSDIVVAVKSYYANEASRRFARFAGGHPFISVRFPEGVDKLYDVDETDVAEVRVVKRGKPFARRDTIHLTGYPIRVFVRGTLTTSKGSDKPFQGEVDFVLSYLPPDESRVDPGQGAWAAIVSNGPFIIN